MQSKKEILFDRLTSELRGINGLARVMQEQPVRRGR